VVVVKFFEIIDEIVYTLCIQKLHRSEMPCYLSLGDYLSDHL
jgi:hypothetical protein